MRLLLDTHVALWWLGGSARITDETAAAIEAAEEAVVSAASVWEVEIKRSVGKLAVPSDFREQIRSAGFRDLAITSLHAEEAARLPSHHRDPFDRILIAQARVEGLVLVTADRELLQYEVAVYPLGQSS